MAKKRCPLLKAVEHNWGLKGPGDWQEVKWLIYFDGSYEVEVTFDPSSGAFDEIDGIERPVRKIKTGQMKAETFSKLRETMKREPWKDPSIDTFACDGVAWEIESYKEDGSVDKSNGTLGYIYGQQVLETMVGLLPKTGNLYHCSALSGRKKNE